MNRELKFRAWSENKKILYKPFNLIEYMISSESAQEKMCPSVNKSLMQFTGLLDKNKKEIYEGDVLNDGSIILYCPECYSFQPHYFDGKEYICHSCEGNMNWFDIVNDKEEYEIVGNIFENPELLDN